MNDRPDGLPSTEATAPLRSGPVTALAPDVTAVESDLAAATRVCRNCGSTYSIGDRFCATCGTVLRADAAQEVARRDPLIGAIIAERYQVVARIGSGGMGAVYRVRHVRLERYAAMKLLHGDLLRDESMVKRFRREARAVSRLTCRHTVSVFDFGRSAGLVYLVMELLQGKDLDEVLQAEGPLKPARVARLMLQMAESLDEAHEQGMVHRDVKPSNAFLCQTVDGNDLLKVLDFGLAKDVVAKDESAELTAMQSHATVIGTPSYMAPEQIQSQPVSAQTDIYAMGCMMYTLLTGRPPFLADTPLQLLMCHLTSAYPTLATFDPSLAPFDGVLHKALQKHSEDRWRTAGDLARAFAAVVGEVDSQAALELPAYAVDSETERALSLGTRDEFEAFERGMQARRLGAYTVGVLLAAMFATGVWWLGWGLPAQMVRFESEKNNDTPEADRLAPGILMQGVLDPGPGTSIDDIDVYRIEVPSPELRASIQLTGIPELDVQLGIRYVDGQGSVLIVDSETDSEGENLTGFVSRDPAFYVVVQPSPNATIRRNGEYPYQLLVQFRPALLGEEREPNDTYSRAATLAVGQRALGYLGWNGDVDRWIVPAVDQPLRVTVSGIPGVDLVLGLVEANGPGQQESGQAMDAGGAGEAETLVISPSDSPRQLVIGAEPAASDLLSGYLLTLEPLQAASLRTHEPSAFFDDALRRLRRSEAEAAEEEPVRQNARPRTPRTPNRPGRPTAAPVGVGSSDDTDSPRAEREADSNGAPSEE
jgi:tRNA A-37 threonylcarbamoyl transferase component Bud32